MIAVTIILILSIVGYGFLWEKGTIPYSPHSDIISEHIGSKTVLHRSLENDHGFPFWRNDQFSGYPAFTNPQSLFLYPLHFLFFFLPPEDAIGPTLWLHFFAAALIFYVLGGVLELDRWARLFMATAMLFNFKLIMAAYAGWLPHLPGLVFFPLLFAALFYFMKNPCLKGMLALCGAGALCLHTGHLQYFYYACCFLVIFCIWQMWQWIRSRETRRVRRTIGILLTGCLLGVGIVAYFFIPLAAEAPHISRGEASYNFFLANHALTFSHLLTLFYPEALGSVLDGSSISTEMWEDVAYFGLIPFLLLFVGVMGSGRRKYTTFLFISFALALILSMDNLLLRFLHDYLPGFQLFRCPSRFLFLAAFFGICLSGIGLDEIRSRMRTKGSKQWITNAFVISLLFFMSAEGFFYARRYISTVPQEQVLPRTDYQRQLAKDNSVYRVAPFNRATINYGWAAHMDLQLITGYDSFNLSHYQRYFDLLQWGTISQKDARVWTDLTKLSKTSLLDALNVKYLISTSPLPLPSSQFELIGYWKDQPVFIFYKGMEQSQIYLYRNKMFLKRAFWVNQVIEVKDEASLVDLMKDKELRTTAILEGANEEVHSCDTDPGDSVEVLKAYGGYLELNVKSKARRYLVFSEVWHPGWKATINGQNLKIHRTNLALMGSWIPAGKNQIKLVFKPIYWISSIGITIFSSIVFVALSLIAFRRGISLPWSEKKQ